MRDMLAFLTLHPVMKSISKMPLQTPKVSLPVGWVMLTLSVIYPVGVIGVEFFTRICTEYFFDPIPTVFHLLLVLYVPAVNLAVWLKLRSHITVADRYLLLSSAIAMTIAAYYTIIFLPILPIAAIGILFMGLGLLPFAPLVSFVGTVKLYRRLKRVGGEGGTQASYIWKGVLITLLMLVVLDLPSGATYFGVNLAISNNSEEHNRGIKLLRMLGDEDLLLRLSYDGNRRATGLISFIALMSNESDRISSKKARQIYYKVTGEPFNHKQVPYDGSAWSRMGALRFDNDLGGTEVGDRVEGLEMISSSLDGSVSSEDNLMYMEWTMEFQNASPFQREARIQLALPPGGVVSRASLWVEGEEREAAFAGRAKARQAYESVVRTRRDPLLVTTSGADRVLAQAFPIPPNGGTIKFKIGVTAPLQIDSFDEASLMMPAIVDRNFSFTAQFKHFLWIESKQPMQLNVSDVTSEHVGTNLHRLVGKITDAELSGIRKLFKVSRDGSVTRRVASFGEDKAILQEIVDFKSDFNGALLIVVDGSKSVGSHREVLISLFDHIPEGKKVGLIVASEELTSIKVDVWSKHQKKLLVEQLRKYKFVGGRDNAPSLVAALKALEVHEDSELLWIHAPQPMLFETTNAQLTQVLDRLTRLPKISLYSLKPGPNKLLTIPYFELNSRTIPNLGNEKVELSRYIRNLYSNESEYKTQRSLIEKTDEEMNGSPHIRRLWVRDTVFELIKNNGKDEALELAATNQLVTPVSSAVVLENQQQYKDNDLNPVEKNSVPTIPEPRQWILAFITLVFLLWFIRRNKLNFASPV